MLDLLPDNIGTHIALVVVSVAILWKSADWFVEGAVGIAKRLNVPPMLVGLVLVSIATTAPELMASLMAALQGIPEVALGNAVGSIMVNVSVALGVAAVVASTPLTADPRLLRTSAAFSLLVMCLCFAMAFNGTLARWEGALLLAMYLVYVSVSYVRARRSVARGAEAIEADADVAEIEAAVGDLSGGKIVLLFVVGAVGIISGSRCLLHGAVGIAEYCKLPSVVIGLTVVAIGTSVPEIATVIASALKKESSVGIGNVVGANILNICWVAGLSAMANPLSSPKSVLLIMFPAMLIIVLAMLAMFRFGHRLVRWNGVVLLALYVMYLVVLLMVAPSAAAAVNG